jgi:hypothetical protein
MPAGDAQRAWFPEMLADLKSHWSSDMTWEGLAVFCHDMTEKRQRIKEANGINPPRMACKQCGGRMVLRPISIRSALFALRKINAVDEAEFQKLDREWGKHRKAHGLDAFGNRPRP